MTGFFSSLFGRLPNGKDGWNQAQREALVDLLVFAMYADGHLSLAEEKVLENQAAELAWESSQSIESYVNETTERVRLARGTEDGTENLLVSIRERLGDFEDRERAFFVCESLLSSDGRPPVEVAFADRCKAGLGL